MQAETQKTGIGKVVEFLFPRRIEATAPVEIDDNLDFMTVGSVGFTIALATVVFGHLANLALQKVLEHP